MLFQVSLMKLLHKLMVFYLSSMVLTELLFIVILMKLLLFFRTDADKVMACKVPHPGLSKCNLLTPAVQAGLWHTGRRIRQGPQLLRAGSGHQSPQIWDKGNHYQLQCCLSDDNLLFCLSYENVQVYTCIVKVAFEKGLLKTVKDLYESINDCLIFFLHSTGKCEVYTILSC